MESQNNEDVPFSSYEIRDMRRMMQRHREDQSRQSNNTASPPPHSQLNITGKAPETAIQKLSRFKKFAPKPFQGASTPTEAEEWLEEVETVLDALRTEEDDKMIFTEFLLHGEARQWWKNEKKKKPSEDHSWREFQELFLQRYFLLSVHEKKRKEFLNLTQGTMSVIEYDKEFNKLARFAEGLISSEKYRVEKFLNGLKMSLLKDVSMLELSTHAEALDKVLKAEWIREQMNTDSKTREKRKAQPSDRQENKQGQWTDEKKKKYEEGCKHCGRNHEVKDCPWTTGSCFQCGEKGHLIAHCPKKPNQEGQKRNSEGQGQHQKTQGRLYNMAKEDANNASDSVQDSDDNPLY